VPSSPARTSARPRKAATAISYVPFAAVATDFEAEGLLDGLDDEARDARRRLLEQLERDGVPLDELRAAVAEGRLALLPLERALAPPGERFTFAQMAERAELDKEFLAGLTRALGLPIPDDDEPIFTEPDLTAARTVGRFRSAGIGDEELLEVTRVLGYSLSQIVAALRSMFTQSFFKPGDSEYDVATRWAAAAKELNPLLEEVVQYLLRAQQVAQLRQGVFDLAGLGTGATQISIAFADLAGFTRLGEQVAADQLGSVAGRLTALATDRAQPPVRLVKMIGDAAMLVSPEPRPLLEALLDLLERVESEGEEFPPLRAGVACGEGLSRGGDWFGSPVNLASRITDKTRPGAVVVTSDFKDQVGEDGYNWTRLPGKRKFKGISEEQVLFRVRRGEDG
jgi:adenylate cyclase